MSALARPVLTPKEYLTLEERSEFRHEYLDGVMYAMAGSTPNRAFLTAAMIGVLWSGLHGRGCSVFSGDLQIPVSGNNGPFFYADVAVKYGESQALVLVVEVLSKSTEKYDRSVKFREYQKIESLREYVLVSQNEPRIESWLRDADGTWRQTIFSGTDSVCELRSVGCSILLGDVYRGLPPE